MIIFHHTDHDGHCAAAIAGEWGRLNGQQTIQFVSMGYDKGPPLNRISPNEMVVIVDYSFTPEVMAKVFEITQNVVWCDHHIACKGYDYGREISGIRDFMHRGRASCEVTWNHFFPDVSMPRAVSLIGDYDAWRHRLSPQSTQFYEVLKMYDTDPDSSVWWNLFHGKMDVDAIIKDGDLIVKYRNAYCEDMCKSFGYETELLGNKAYACNIYRFGSNGFGDRLQKYPLLISYFHDGTKYRVSLYSDTINVSDLAKKFGGGGHKGSAAFIAKELPWI